MADLRKLALCKAQEAVHKFAAYVGAPCGLPATQGPIANMVNVAANVTAPTVRTGANAAVGAAAPAAGASIPPAAGLGAATTPAAGASTAPAAATGAGASAAAPAAVASAATAAGLGAAAPAPAAAAAPNFAAAANAIASRPPPGIVRGQATASPQAEPATGKARGITQRGSPRVNRPIPPTKPSSSKRARVSNTP
jgi:hypothetical protein